MADNYVDAAHIQEGQRRGEEYEGEIVSWGEADRPRWGQDGARQGRAGLQYQTYLCMRFCKPHQHLSTHTHTNTYTHTHIGTCINYAWVVVVYRGL